MIDDSYTPPSEPRPVRRALLSVYDKTGVADFAQRLDALGVELVSTGGTAQALRDAGLEVTDVADLTGFPEVLDGRVKSMHPAVHAGLLARRGHEGDEADLDEHDLAPIDLVACNLYPFEEAVSAGDADDVAATANIDIGGPTMLRAAAKNFFAVAAVTDPAAYDAVAEELEAEGGALAAGTRRRLAGAAFEHTARYDRAVADYFAGAEAGDAAGESAAQEDTDGESAAQEQADAGEDADALPETFALSLPRAQALRYGENPHQEASLYGDPSPFFEKLHGKALSYNNLNDLSAALMLIDEFRDDDPACAIIKHTNPTGVAVASSLEAAYQRAFSTDRQSPFGGIVVVNRPLDRPTAEAIDRIFTEIIVAPGFEDGVMGFLQEKKKRRLVRAKAAARTDRRPDVRAVLGGLLVQERDPVVLPGRDRWDVPTERAPTDQEARDLAFAWRVAKHVKSNAIVYAKGQATLGIGAGQMSRVDASELAVRKGAKAELDFTGSVVASDAFFPFADGLEAAAEAGATAAIQPGGSIRDEEVTRAADAAGVAMVCTGRRHFRH